MVTEIEIKANKIPVYPNKVQTKQENERPVMLNKYRRLVGKLLSFMSNPSEEHWDLLRKTVSYLCHTIDKGLTLKPDGGGEKVIEAFVDSNMQEI